MRFLLTLILALSLAGCNGCPEDLTLNRVLGEPCYVTTDGVLHIGSDALPFDVGQCSLGRTVEGEDGRTECEGQVDPSYERCDGVDNDCDNIVDNPDQLQINPWDPDNRCKQFGKCAGTVEVCDNGEWTCDYRHGPPSSDDNCNNVDDDCDGRTDEEFSNELVFCYTHEDQATALCGECSVGYEDCRDGVITCVGEVHPRTEICNQKDDDCNCIVDDTDVEESQADILFMIDTSGSMSSTIDDVTNAVCTFAQADSTDTYRFGLVLIATPDQSYSVAQNFGSAQELCDALQALETSGGVEPTLNANRDAVDIVENPLMLSWREPARKVVVGFGDEPAFATECQTGPLNGPCLDSFVQEIMGLCEDNDVAVYWFQTQAEYYQDIAYGCSGNFFYLQPSEFYIVDSLNEMFEEICVEPSN